VLCCADAATVAQASHSRQVKRMQEEKAKLEESIEEVTHDVDQCLS
jgi:hypothetical protein